MFPAAEGNQIFPGIFPQCGRRRRRRRQCASCLTASLSGIFLFFFIRGSQPASCGPLQAEGLVQRAARGTRRVEASHVGALGSMMVYLSREVTLPSSRLVCSSLMRRRRAREGFYERKGVSIGALRLQRVMCMSVHHHETCS